jgi:hypothetical protein
VDDRGRVRRLPRTGSGGVAPCQFVKDRRLAGPGRAAHYEALPGAGTVPVEHDQFLGVLDGGQDVGCVQRELGVVLHADMVRRLG